MYRDNVGRKDGRIPGAYPFPEDLWVVRSGVNENYTGQQCRSRKTFKLYAFIQ